MYLLTKLYNKVYNNCKKKRVSKEKSAYEKGKNRKKQRTSFILVIWKNIKKLKLEDKMNFKNLKEKQGITLIALIITIIVLLILAGISIAMLAGDNGILTRTKSSKQIS